MDSMQYRPSNPNQEVSITNHSGSVSDSLGRLAAESQCMFSFLKTAKLFLYSSLNLRLSALLIKVSFARTVLELVTLFVYDGINNVAVIKFLFCVAACVDTEWFRTQTSVHLHAQTARRTSKQRKI